MRDRWKQQQLLDGNRGRSRTVLVQNLACLFANIELLHTLNCSILIPIELSLPYRNPFPLLCAFRGNPYSPGSTSFVAGWMSLLFRKIKGPGKRLLPPNTFTSLWLVNPLNREEATGDVQSAYPSCTRYPSLLVSPSAARSMVIGV
uniref:Uncharacterized protein n=1 Tax=Steinernema glaseri TaxID=37863 RepID=A0A1I7Z3V1_9BILA